ncbi:unnamed protein product, partial [Timema podura]|nr:unnamed protein product [Timema podura]
MKNATQDPNKTRPLLRDTATPRRAMLRVLATILIVHAVLGSSEPGDPIGANDVTVHKTYEVFPSSTNLALVRQFLVREGVTGDLDFHLDRILKVTVPVDKERTFQDFLNQRTVQYTVVLTRRRFG